MLGENNLHNGQQHFPEPYESALNSCNWTLRFARNSSCRKHPYRKAHSRAPALASLGLRAAFSTRRGLAPHRPPAAALWSLPRNNVDRRLAETPALWPWLLAKAAF